MSHVCPLCRSQDTVNYHQDKRRCYEQCRQCQLVFVDSAFLPTAEEEKAEYDLHQNHEHDEGYRRFLVRMVDALAPNLPKSAQGIDFGCGQTRLLASLFEQKGHTMDVYDPIYFSDTANLNKSYDFIVCTEAIEHFHHPYKEWGLWQKWLKPGGWLGIMTKRVANCEKFAAWHYKNDKTHVSFFSETTFKWLATRDQFKVMFPNNDIVLLQKHS